MKTSYWHETRLAILVELPCRSFDLAPSKIFINIGTNDIGFQVKSEIFHENYEKIIRQIQATLPDAEIFVLKYYPVNNIDFGSDQDEAVLFATRSNELFNLASEKNREMASLLGVNFIDVSDGLADEHGNLKKAYTIDGAHLSPDGCKVILENLAPYL